MIVLMMLRYIDSLFHVHRIENNHFHGVVSFTVLAECLSQATWLKKLK